MRACELFGGWDFAVVAEDAADKIADATRRKGDAARSYQSKLKALSASDRYLAAAKPTPERRCRAVANNEKRAEAKAQYQSALSKAETARRAAMAKPSSR
jgi:hypothetical protein